MRFLKLAVLSAAVFFTIITAMSLLIPSHIRISKAVNLSTSADSVLYLVTNRDQWPRWHPAFRFQHMDSLLLQNKLRITPVAKTDSLVTMNWQQEGKNAIANSWQIHRFAGSDSVALQWYMDFRLKWYPWQKFSSLFYENTYGRLMEQGLQNIKTIVQENK